MTSEVSYTNFTAENNLSFLTVDHVQQNIFRLKDNSKIKVRSDHKRSYFKYSTRPALHESIIVSFQFVMMAPVVVKSKR